MPPVPDDDDKAIVDVSFYNLRTLAKTSIRKVMGPIELSQLIDTYAPRGQDVVIQAYQMVPIICVSGAEIKEADPSTVPPSKLDLN